jgi:hypothetical protein
MIPAVDDAASDPGAQGVTASKQWDRRMSGWRSNFRSAAVQLRDQRAELLALVGRRLTAGWAGWNPHRHRWFPPFPLVLVFGDGVQLELAWQKWDDLAITWNTIDLTAPPDDEPYQWRPSQPDPVAAVAGRTLTGFAAIETPYFQGDDLDFADGLPMHALAGWMFSGLWIEFGDRGVHVYNHLDMNGLSAEPVKPPYETATRSTRWSSP